MDRCVICGRLVPEGRMVCIACERAHNTPYECVYFDPNNYICLLSGDDCSGDEHCKTKEE